LFLLLVCMVSQSRYQLRYHGKSQFQIKNHKKMKKS
jgi:hypothetical protein